MSKNYEVIVKVEKNGNRFNAFDTDGTKRTSEISTDTRKRAFENSSLIGRYTTTLVNIIGNYSVQIQPRMQLLKR